jgi:membrane protease YdiL (CAAX protease family)
MMNDVFPSPEAIMKHPASWLAAILLIFPVTFGVVVADRTSERLCRLVLAEEQIERDDLALERVHSRTQLVAARDIFRLLDELWKKGAVEELAYLRGKHDHDVARLDEDRLSLLLDRQDAIMRQYRGLCEALSSGETGTDERRAIDEAYEKYRETECASRLKEAEIAEADLHYGIAVLESFKELERNDLTTSQDIILAERDVDIFRKSLFAMGLAVILPILSLRTVHRVEAAGIGRTALYANISFSLWLLAGLCALVVWLDGDAPADVFLRIDVIPGAEVAITWAVLICAAGILLFVMSQLIGNRMGWRGEESMLQRMRPVDRRDFVWIVLILSPTAGFCEELIYRGFLISRLLDLTGSMTVSVLISSAIFGVSHLYQGPWGALRAGLIGLLLAVPVATLGTIVPSIIAHALIDAVAIPLVWPALERITGDRSGS